MCYLLPIIDDLWKKHVRASDSILHDQPIGSKRYAPFARKIRRLAPDAIIIVPTRELTLQVTAIIRNLSKGSDMRCQSFFCDTTKHGFKRKRQLEAMLARAAKGANIIVTTVGFLKYVQKVNAMSFDRISYLVFDEADELFDVNFAKDIMRFMYWSGLDLYKNKIMQNS